MRPTTHDSEETTEVYIEVLKQVNVWCIWIVFITTLQSAYPKIQFIWIIQQMLSVTKV